jgi:hypothetical protein
MWRAALYLLLIAYLPGALVFRLPVLRRDLRAAISIEERLFWHVIISLAISSALGLALAAAGVYSLPRLLLANGVVTTTLLVVGRGQLRLPASTPRLGWTAALPAGLIVLATLIVFHVPPSEYVMGGKDPGVYVNEGILIDKQGSLAITDSLVASLPTEFLSLYIPRFTTPTQTVPWGASYGDRFLGFHLVDPDQGEVAGQFLHFYPLLVAIGYNINGLTGVRSVIGLLAILGIVALYFCGVWLVGRPAATGGALLLTLNVANVWYSRYPNAEISLQVLVFAGLLAFSRATVDGDRFFAPVAALLVTLACFAHVTGVLFMGAVSAAAVLGQFDRRSPPVTFLLLLAVGAVLTTLYYAMVMAVYMERHVRFISNIPYITAWALAAIVFGGLLLRLFRSRAAPRLRAGLPWVVVGVVGVLATYAYFFRVPVGRLAPHDADSLRTFTHFYLTPLGLAAALVGLLVIVRRRFWPGLAFLVTLIGFSLVFFYKIRVVPEHFWAARRFLAVILPGACLLIGTAAFPQAFGSSVDGRRARALMFGVGVVIVMAIGFQYAQATLPILKHVEYAGLIPQLETLNAQIQRTDLVLVESRQSSDLHTLALPLGYIYDRQVLVFHPPNPDKDLFKKFMAWAKGRYRRVLFIGGGGSLLESRSVMAVPLSTARFEIPEYESPYHTYPREVRSKRYDVSLYELMPRLTPPEGFNLDVGGEDELLTRRFFPRERIEGVGTSFRWSRDFSVVSVLGISPERRTLTLWMSKGGRPENAAPASVTVTLDDRHLGTVTIGARFEPHQFDVPADLAAEFSTREAPGVLRLRSDTWNPSELLGADDRRDLGVMVERITVE